MDWNSHWIWQTVIAEHWIWQTQIADLLQLEKWPSCPLWIHTGWYATPDTTVLKAQLVVVILGDCPGLYKKDRQTEGGGGVQMCDITSHFCLASLFVAALSLCVFVSLYDMHEYSNSSTRLSRGQNGSKRHRRRRHTKTSMGIWLWAMHN